MNWKFYLFLTKLTQLGLSVSSNLAWKPHIHSIAKHASQKLCFLSRDCVFFFPSQLLTIYKSQIRPSQEYYFHAWGGAPKSSLHLLDKIQYKAIRPINNPGLAKSLQSLSLIVVCLQIFPFSIDIFMKTINMLTGNQEYYS